LTRGEKRERKEEREELVKEGEENKRETKIYLVKYITCLQM